MNNTFFYLIGRSGVGKRTIAREIARLTGARVIDAADIYEPIFNLIEHASPADLPDAAWAQVDAIREVILRTIETLSPVAWSFVFTHAGFDIPEDVGVYHTVRDTARKRSAKFQPARLIDPELKRPLLTFEEPAIDIQMSTMSPTDAANAIVAAAGRSS